VNINRRDFLKMLSAGAIIAAAPRWPEAGVVQPDLRHVGPWVEFDCQTLPSGSYTFSAFVKGPDGEWKGLIVQGLKANGGETKIRIPLDLGHRIERPVLSDTGIVATFDGERVEAHVDRGEARNQIIGVSGSGHADMPFPVIRIHAGDQTLELSRAQLEVNPATAYIPTTSRRAKPVSRGYGPRPRRMWALR
jgi:hypothetical protein